jgi:hypothetical protein
MRELQGISRKLSLTVNFYNGYVADFHYFENEGLGCAYC